MASRSSGGGRSTGPSRYQRSSTASMTQLLSDSCSSLLHRLTSRVRGPSASVDSPASSSRGVGASAGLSLSTLSPSLSSWSNSAATPRADHPSGSAPDRGKDRDRARDRDYDHDPGRPRSPTFSTFGQTRSRLEKKYGQKKTTSPSPSARRSTQRGRHSKPRAAAASGNPTATGAATRKDAKDGSPLLGVSKVRHTDHYGARSVRTPSSPQPELGSTRSRLEDKYSAILAKYGRETREVERTAERRGAEGQGHGDRRSPQPLALSKSATTSIVLSEKAYPYVSSGPGLGPGPAREKTPYRYGERRSRQRSGHRAAPPRLCPVEFDVDAVDVVATAPPPRTRIMSPGEREALMLVAAEEQREQRERERERERERPSSPATNEREARRKEIQSLIAKYTTAVNDRLQKREEREQREYKEKAAAAAAAAPTTTTPAASAAKNTNLKGDSGTLTPTMGAGRATTAVNNVAPSTPMGPGHGYGLGLGAGHGKVAGAGGLVPGVGHSLGKSASGVFSSTLSDSGALYKNQSKYSMLNRRPMASSSATSLALPNFSFVRSVLRAMLRALRDSMGPAQPALAGRRHPHPLNAHTLCVPCVLRVT